MAAKALLRQDDFSMRWLNLLTTGFAVLTSAGSGFAAGDGERIDSRRPDLAVNPDVHDPLSRFGPVTLADRHHNSKLHMPETSSAPKVPTLVWHVAYPHPTVGARKVDTKQQLS